MNEFHNSLKNELDIIGIPYTIETEECARDRDGYVIENRCACTLTEFGWKYAKNVFFNTQNISDYINNSFAKVYSKEAFDRIINITISYLLAHELIHVLQIKQGRLTKEIFEDEKKIHYKDRSTEIEADLMASEILGKCDRFTIGVCKLIRERRSAGSEEVKNLMYYF